MTRDQVIAAINSAFDCVMAERCASESERKITEDELKEVLTWIRQDDQS